jgi:hypothetical protein
MTLPRVWLAAFCVLMAAFSTAAWATQEGASADRNEWNACTQTAGSPDDVYTQGEVVGRGNIHNADVCLNPSTLQKGYCEPRARLGFKTMFVECAYGCYNGACQPKDVRYLSDESGKQTYGDAVRPNVEAGAVLTWKLRLKCVQTSGNEDYYTSGFAVGANGMMTDRCVSGTTLRKAVCSGFNVDSVMLICENGCSQGACVQESTAPESAD